MSNDPMTDDRMTDDHRAQPGRDMAEFLSFCVGAEEFCLDIMTVREIRGWTAPTPLPHAPAHLSGVVNLRGTILPIIDLAARLGLPPTRAEARHVVIVVEIGTQAAGLVVDVVSGILALSRNRLEPPPAVPGGIATGCLSALSLLEGRMLRIIDLATILPGGRVAAA